MDLLPGEGEAFTFIDLSGRARGLKHAVGDLSGVWEDTETHG
jgi:hypothetical protein